jgi:hypothetical protein
MLARFANRSLSLAGCATPESTLAFSHSNPAVHQLNFRRTYGSSLTLSSISIRTYVGAPTEEVDRLVEDAVYESVRSGCINVIDTAINYRYG